MLIKSIFDPIDRLILQAKGYIQEQDVRKKYIRQIEDKIKDIQPELEKRKEELIGLIEKIDPEDNLKAELELNLNKLLNYLEHIELIAEKELALSLMPQENQESVLAREKMRENYVNHQLARLHEQLKVTGSFFEVADFANEIWADYDLFEEFNKEDMVVQLLVDRMNETNTKNTETRIGKDLKKTLEHIRLNLVKSTSWSDQEIDSYQKERNLKINQLKTINIPNDRHFHILMFGGVPEIIEELSRYFIIPSQLKIEWIDVESGENLEPLIKNGKNDMAIFFSMFPNHKKFIEIKDKLTQESIPYFNVISFSTQKLVQSIEEELLKISFQEHFAYK
ncbi:MAG: hypothetical protein OEY59_05435 [Deltaproteobacteria bacterium]|nr:hypothetical protein [Deltaproteobacteria bacterium]